MYVKINLQIHRLEVIMGFFKKLFGGFKKEKNAKEEAKVAAEEIKTEKVAETTEPKKEEIKPAEINKKTEEKKVEEKAEEAPACEKCEAKAEEKKAEPKEDDKPSEEAKKPLGKFVITKAADGRFMFNLKAANNYIIATSGMYTTLAACKTGIESVATNAPIAPVEDQTLKNCETLTNPKFELYRDKGGEFRFRLNARNGEGIAVSQGYKSKASCKNGIESVRTNCVAPVINEIDAE